MFTLEVLRGPVWQGLTWTLLHFLWQGLAVAVALMLLLWLLGPRRPQLRYLLCMGGMGLMMLCPMVTFFVLWDGADWGAGQAKSTIASDVFVDLGPAAPPEPVLDTFEPSIAPIMAPLLPEPQTLEPGLWKQLGGYARAAQPYMLSAWVLGVLCLSGRLLLGVVGAGWLRRSREAIPSRLADTVARLSSAIGLRSPGRVCISSRIREAMVVGLLRPMVLLPAAWATEMTPEILEAIIAHELAHIRRWDLWATLFQRLVETLLFYHPAVWWISSRVSSEREKCCDELAVAATGRRLTYARALEKTAAIRLASTGSALGAAFGGRRMTVLDRVTHILGMSPARKNQRARWWPVGLLVLLVFVGVYRVAFHMPSPIVNEAKAEQFQQPDPLQSDTKAKSKKDSAKPAASSITTVRGNVVDDVTGKPVTNFITQAGKFDPADPAKVTWGYSETHGGWKDGKFSTTVRWSQGWTARIVAPGYLPQPVLSQAPPTGQDVIEVTVRLRRGGMVRGRVLDHAGKPVAGAGIYLVGPKAISLDQGPHGEFQEATVHTDAEGRFEISGRDKDSKAIIVNAPSLFVWRADLPEPDKEAVIRLPQPARLHIRYDIEGGPPEAQIRIAFCSWDMPKWKGTVNAVSLAHVKQGGDGLVVENLPPGVYDVSRTKKFRAGKTGWNKSGVMLDRQLNLKLTTGKTIPYNLVRKTGTPISGHVVGLPKEGVSGVYVYIRDPRVSSNPRNLGDWKLPTSDGLALEGNDSFKTERIEPGKYKVVAEAYRQETPEEMTYSGVRLPKWIGTAIVNVPESGDPPNVRVEMREYDAKAKTGKAEAADKPQPKDKSAQALFKKWQNNARANGDIPGGALGSLAGTMKKFIKLNPTDERAPKLAELLKRIDTSHDWTQVDAAALLDDVTAVYADLPKWAIDLPRFSIAQSIRTGQPLPAGLKDAPWGKAQPNGLRTAWLLEPRAKQYRLGMPLKSRILFHNTGKNAVVFRVLTWNQSNDHKARDANGAEIKISSTQWTTIPLVVACRLAPGEYTEVVGAGIGIGANRNNEDRHEVRVGSWIEAKEGDEVTFTPAPVSVRGKYNVGQLKDGPHWWPDFITNRLKRDAPLPDDAAERKRLLDRAMRDLFGTLPTPEETAAFVADRAPDAMGALADRLAQRVGISPFTGTLQAGETKFRVLADAPDAEKKPRVNDHATTKRVDLGIIVARHVLLLDGKKIITWDELEKRIAALPDPAWVHPHFYITRGAREAGIYPVAKEKIWHLHKKFKLKGHSEGSLWPRSDFRYDQIKTEKDLVPNVLLRVEGRIVDNKGRPVADADVFLVAPVDKTIPYKSYHIALVDGRVRNQLEHIMTRSDEKGRFELYPPKDTKCYVVALHPTAGFTLQQGKQLSNGKLQLMPWANLESRFGGEKAQQQGASLSTQVQEKDGYPEVIFNQDSNSQKSSKKDTPAGMFRFAHVPPIFNTTISRVFPDKQGTSFSSPGVTVSLLPGESRRQDLGPMSDKRLEMLEWIRKESRSRQEKLLLKSTSKKDGAEKNDKSKKATVAQPATLLPSKKVNPGPPKNSLKR
ncbi:MAG: DUF1549 domain-containing protein [Pirellulales bacterium]|nr:DUF1549 domain-containing protein [Pirellulales bacterium]